MSQTAIFKPPLKEERKAIHFLENVRYAGKKGSDGMPGDEAVCTEVSVALEQILEFEPFAPNEKFGTMHKDNGDYGWTDYYYSLLIQKGINLVIYCEDDGTVNQETHIIVRQVK